MAARHDLVILAVNADSARAQLLLGEWLQRINGDSGRSCFDGAIAWRRFMPDTTKHHGCLGQRRGRGASDLPGRAVISSNVHNVADLTDL